MQAACGLAQMDKLESFIAARRRNFTFLREQLKELESDLIFPQATPNSDPSWFGFPITLRDHVDIDRADLLKCLEREKVGTRLLFAGNLTHQPYMKDQNFRVSGDLKVSDIVMKRTFWIGLQPSLTEEMLLYTASTLKRFIKKSQF